MTGWQARGEDGPRWPARRVLLVHLGGLGDVLLARATIRAVRALYAGSDCWLLTAARARPAVRDLVEDRQLEAPEVDAVAFRGWRLMGNPQLGPLLAACLRLRRQQFDLVVSLCSISSWAGAGKLAAIRAVVGGRAWVGRDTDGRGFFLTHRVPEDGGEARHETERAYAVARWLGAQGPAGVDLPLRPQDDVAAVAFLATHRIRAGECLIAVNPAAAWVSHRWPLERFAGLLGAIRREVACRFVIIGGRSDTALAHRLVQMVGGPVLVSAGVLDLFATAALLTRCRLLITNDTAAMHLASSVGTPTVAVLGCTDTARFQPLLPAGASRVVRPETGHPPCERPRCWRRALAQVQVGEVLAAVRGVLHGDPREVLRVVA